MARASGSAVYHSIKRNFFPDGGGSVVVWVLVGCGDVTACRAMDGWMDGCVLLPTERTNERTNDGTNQRIFLGSSSHRSISVSHSLVHPSMPCRQAGSGSQLSLSISRILPSRPSRTFDHRPTLTIPYIIRLLAHLGP